MSEPSFVFRVDSCKDSGEGHFRRCLQLAKLCQSHGKVYFISQKLLEHHFEILHQSQIEYTYFHKNDLTLEQDAYYTKRILSEWPTVPTWLIVDHYQLDYAWERKQKNICKAIAVIDDLANRKHDCELLIDSGYLRTPQTYKTLLPSTCKLLTGSKFLILDKSFQHNSITNPVKNYLHIFFGSSDQSELTKIYSQWLLEDEDFFDIIIKAAVGHNYPDLKSLEQLQNLYKQRFDYQYNLNNLKIHMQQAQWALGAPGTALWERMCLKIPTACISTHPNQVDILKDIEKSGLCSYLGSSETLTKTEFKTSFSEFIEKKASIIANKLTHTHIDGLGAHRIVQALLSFSEAGESV